MLRNLYLVVVRAVRWFFAATHLPKPGIARRANRSLRKRYIDAQRDTGRGASSVEAQVRHDAVQPDVREEIAALTSAIERLETMAYLDRVDHRPD